MGAFELGFHEQQTHRARRAQRSEYAGQSGQANERQIGHHDIERRAKLGRNGRFDIRTLEHAHAFIFAELPRELSVVHVDARDFSGARLKQTVGKTARRRANIDAARPAHILSKRIERPLELMPATAHIGATIAHEHIGIGVHQYRGACGIHVIRAHLMCENRAQRFAPIGEIAALNEQIVQADFLLFRFFGLRRAWLRSFLRHAYSSAYFSRMRAAMPSASMPSI